MRRAALESVAGVPVCTGGYWSHQSVRGELAATPGTATVSGIRDGWSYLPWPLLYEYRWKVGSAAISGYTAGTHGVRALLRRRGKHSSPCLVTCQRRQADVECE